MANVVLPQWLSVGGTDTVATDLVSNARVAERVRARGVYRVYKRLETDLAHEIIVYLDGVVVEVVGSSLVALSTAVADDDGSPS